MSEVNVFKHEGPLNLVQLISYVPAAEVDKELALMWEIIKKHALSQQNMPDGLTALSVFVGLTKETAQEVFDRQSQLVTLSGAKVPTREAADRNHASRESTGE